MKPLAKNARVLRYGDNDVQAMIQLGYRMSDDLAETYGFKAGQAELDKVVGQPTAGTGDRHRDLRKMLDEHRDDLISKYIIARWVATLVLNDEWDPTESLLLRRIPVTLLMFFGSWACSSMVRAGDSSMVPAGWKLPPGCGEIR